MNATSNEGTASSVSAVEAELLERAVELAGDNGAMGQLPYGALVVRDGAVLGSGVNTAVRDHDPTAHAEVAAVRDACRSLGTLDLTGAAILTSCQPCGMCHAVAATAGITRILYAAQKAEAPVLGDPPPPAYLALTTGVRDTLRESFPDQVAYVPTRGAYEPFQRYLDRDNPAR